MPQRKKNEAAATRTHTLSLNQYDRLVLRDRVLTIGGGSLQEKMQIIYLRRDLGLTPDEAALINLQEPRPQQYTWDRNINRDFDLGEEEYELVRRCFRLMIAAESLQGDSRFDELLLKFFTLDELAGILQEQEQRASRRR